ncbi:hypothetical protein F5Y15DRAFT_430031 [Xylariaceae sp. FL0016]|nr:hypothetical protein F5Y15DRAFT_430031 [Xylariaceae sp. FL0016]
MAAQNPNSGQRAVPGDFTAPDGIGRDIESATYPSQPAITQRSPPFSMHARVSDARETLDELYTDGDVLKHVPPGWSSIAATGARFSNFRVLPIFPRLDMRTGTLMAAKLKYLEERIDEIDIRESEGAAQDDLKALPFDKEQFRTRCLEVQRGCLDPKESLVAQSPTTATASLVDSRMSLMTPRAEREKLLECAIELSGEYYELMNRISNSQRHAKVSFRAHQAIFEVMKSSQGLTDEALGFMRTSGDLVYLDQHRVSRFLEYFLYAKDSVTTRAIGWLCRGRRLSKQEDGSIYMDYGSELIDVVFRAFTAILASALFLIPVAILYLAELTKTISFLVVLGFGGLFAVIITAVEPRMSRILVVVAAYYAVLVTFMANSE